MKIKKNIVVPYCSDWPTIFEREASKIKEILGTKMKQDQMLLAFIARMAIAICLSMI
jgi:hypothetical protein